MASSPTICVPSSSVQVSTTGPDSTALNLNWIYGLADTAGSNSAANTCRPFTVQVNLLRILRGIVLPLASLRCPVSMTCDTRAFTSTRSPFLASFLSSLIRGLTVDIVVLLEGRCGGQQSAAATADRDLHLLPVQVAVAVVHLGDGGDVLRFRQADARIRLGDAAGRREVKHDHAAARVAVSDDDHVADIGLLGHRAVHRHGHRYRVAVLGDLRQVKLDATLLGLLAAGEFRDEVLRVVGGLRGRAPHARHDRHPAESDLERLTTIADGYHGLGTLLAGAACASKHIHLSLSV